MVKTCLLNVFSWKFTILNAISSSILKLALYSLVVEHQVYMIWQAKARIFSKQMSNA